MNGALAVTRYTLLELSRRRILLVFAVIGALGIVALGVGLKLLYEVAAANRFGNDRVDPMLLAKFLELQFVTYVVQALGLFALLIAFGIEMGAGAIHFNELGLARWVHILSGIMWIGLLYYFNVVQVPGLAAAAADKGGPGGAGVTKYIAPRALLWFRWAAVATWLTGAWYLGPRFMDALTLGHGGKARARATNASISDEIVSANFCSNNTAVSGFLNANFMVS